MVDYGRKWYRLCFQNIGGPKAKNGSKCLILLVTVLFIGEEC